MMPPQHSVTLRLIRQKIPSQKASFFLENVEAYCEECESISRRENRRCCALPPPRMHETLGRLPHGFLLPTRPGNTRCGHSRSHLARPVPRDNTRGASYPPLAVRTLPKTLRRVVP